MDEKEKSLLAMLNERVANGEILNEQQAKLHERLGEKELILLRTGASAARDLKESVESIVDARYKQIHMTGDKGPTTYAEFVQNLAQEHLLVASRDFDTELECTWQEFCKAHAGTVEQGFTFTADTETIKFPAQVAPLMPKKILREASKLSAEDRVAKTTNANLMNNLQSPQSTQDFISAAMVKIREHMTIYTPSARAFQLFSFPSPMAYYRKSFRNRSPDLPFWSRSNTSSPHCITFMMDVKPCEEGEFTDEQVGHIIDMARELLTTEQTGRRGMLCGLTDGSRFKFFKVLRRDSSGGADGIEVKASRTFMGKEGWEVLIALMALPLDNSLLMHEEHRVAGLQMYNILGHGARSTVYRVEQDAAEGGVDGGGKEGGKPVGEGKCSSEDRSHLFCKVYTKAPKSELGRGEGWRGFDRERAALRRLQDVPNIPKICVETSALQSAWSIENKEKLERALVLSPVGLPLWPVSDTVVMTGRHFAQLVTTVEAMHSAGVLHRDIKPANVFLQKDNDLLLLADFDAAVLLEEVKDESPPPPVLRVMQQAAPPPPPQMQQKMMQTRSAAVKASARDQFPTPEGSLTVEALTLEAPTRKAWRQDQQFVWVGTVGYSDTRCDSGLHTPTPEHDLVALVRTVYSLYTRNGPRGGGDTDCTDAYWAERMPAASMWHDFLQMAKDKDYGALRLALGRL